MSHIRKEELKHDAVKETLIKFVEFVVLHKERVVAGVIGAFIVIFAIVWYQGNTSKRIEEADMMLTNANGAFFSGDYKSAIASYENLMESYAGTPAANKAIFFAATAYYYSQMYDKAKQKFEEYIKSGKDPLFKASAMMGIGEIYEQQGKYDEAVKQYKLTVEKYPQSIIAPYTYMALARCYEYLNQDDKAIEMYNKIKTDYPNSSIVDESEFYKKLVIGKEEAYGKR